MVSMKMRARKGRRVLTNAMVAADNKMPPRRRDREGKFNAAPS